MSVNTSGQPVGYSAAPNRLNVNSGLSWMIGPWGDSLLILLTPLIAAPVVLTLSSAQVGVKAVTISTIVAAFFALGHHLPGLVRAYGDPELFQRFRWRFLLAPPVVFLGYFPIYNYHFELYRLIILAWATWHGLMQVYGFVRIYDARVGSTSRSTANWDWLVCLCGFVTPRLLRPEALSQTLEYWFVVGGPMISPAALNAVRWCAIAVWVVVLIGFSTNYVWQSYHGVKPNPLKLVMLVSGIGTWWFAICYVDELILGIALFDICHDVQYNAIVWMYNRRLVSSKPQLTGLMKHLFRRGAVMLYVGLITAYGAIGLIPSLVADGTVNNWIYAVIFTSTILHYYYDGFIWKVREKTNQANLGVGANSAVSANRDETSGIYSHVLKWSPVILVLSLLFASDLMDPPLTTQQKQEIERRYSHTLTGKTILPEQEEELSCLYTLFESAQTIAAAVPDDRGAQLKAAVMLANFGRNEEAVVHLEAIMKQHPDYRDALVALGDVHFYLGNFNKAEEYFNAALARSGNGQERSLMNLKLGEIDLVRKDYAAAKIRFNTAVQDDPALRSSVAELQKGHVYP